LECLVEANNAYVALSNASFKSFLVINALMGFLPSNIWLTWSLHVFNCMELYLLNSQFGGEKGENYILELSLALYLGFFPLSA
jgi:hypothetical protein